MKINRKENAKKGVIFGTISNIYTIVVPFFMRTIMLYLLGIQYLGLNSLFSSVLQVLNMAELGVGSAMIYSMYKPIAEDDHEKICALMRLYKIYYRIIGSVILIVGLLITPMLPKLIKGEIPNDINLYILYLINLGYTVLSYWLFAYKNSLLNAFQRRDILSKIAMLTNTLKFALQIAVMVIFKSYYAYVIVMLITQIINNLVTSLVVDHIFPQYKARNTLSKEEVRNINQRVKDLFTQKIGGIINTSADTIVISSFLGLTTLAIYQNYYYVLSLPFALGNVVFDSCRAGIGNSIQTESKKKNLKDFRKFTFIIDWIICVCACGLIAVYQPFIVLWTGEMYTFPIGVVFLFIVYFYVVILGRLFDVYKDAAGIWHQDRMRPFCAAIFNLISNLFMVNFIGIYGILLSTILSLIIISFPWELHNLFTYIFEQGVMSYILMLTKNIFISLLSCSITYFICNFVVFDGIIGIIIKGIIALIVSNLILFVFNYKSDEFKISFLFVKNIVCIHK